MIYMLIRSPLDTCTRKVQTVHMEGQQHLDEKSPGKYGPKKHEHPTYAIKRQLQACRKNLEILQMQKVTNERMRGIIQGQIKTTEDLIKQAEGALLEQESKFRCTRNLGDDLHAIRVKRSKTGDADPDETQGPDEIQGPDETQGPDEEVEVVWEHSGPDETQDPDEEVEVIWEHSDSG